MDNLSIYPRDFLGGWHLLTLRPSFHAKGKTDEQLQMMEFNGDIVRAGAEGYIWNPEKMNGVPGPLAVVEKARTELSEAFVIKGTNDHGIAYLVLYTVSRFAGGSSRHRSSQSSSVFS